MLQEIFEDTVPVFKRPNIKYSLDSSLSKHNWELYMRCVINISADTTSTTATTTNNNNNNNNKPYKVAFSDH
jgi:hypothetical protein